MKNYITVAALLVAGTAFANAATFTTSVSTATSDAAGVGAGVDLPVEGTAEFDIVLDPSKGKFYVEATGTWANQDALNELNSAFSTDYTLKDISALSFSYTGAGGSTSDAILTLKEDSYKVGDSVAVYAFITALQTAPASIAVSGLNNTKISYATNEGSSFVTTVAFSDELKDLTLVKIEGTVAEGKVITLNPGGEKNGWAGIGIAAVAVPEPSAFGLLAGIGALALVASRRRRK